MSGPAPMFDSDHRSHVREPAVVVMTLAVAACSIIYELVFSQALTVVFGHTVTRYALTIGLYLFSLGLGAFLYARTGLKQAAPVFLLVEAVLSLLGPAGLVFILLFGSSSALGGSMRLVLCHAPVIAVGVLSGLELPLLAELSRDRQRSFYRVLGWDYLGSLLGTVGYALWLYPRHGLVVTVLATGFINAGVAAMFSVTRWRGRLVSRVLAGAAVAIYGFALLSAERIADRVEETYLRADIVSRYQTVGVPIRRVDVLDRFRTRYQRVVHFRMFREHGRVDECLELDGQQQVCNFGSEAYHHGLIDVPMLFFPEGKPLRVLLLGGGDYIPVRYLSVYEDIERIVQIDIDPEFLAYARRDPFLLGFNRGAFDEPRLQTIVDDAFHHVRTTSERYDLIVLDLPGLTRDKLLPLYSKEFFAAVRSRLLPGGLAVTWRYDPARWPRHRGIFERTLYEAGFRQQVAFSSINQDRFGFYQQDYYMLLGVGDSSPPQTRSGQGEYMKTWRDIYLRARWRPLPPHDGFRANRVLRPNFSMLIERGL
ncbi:MAG: hypothetical protein AAF605_00755 [Myxococcota bacterium]